MPSVDADLGIGRREIGIVGELALTLGEYAESLLRRFDLGIDRARFRSALLEVCHDLKVVQSTFEASPTGLRFAYVPDSVFDDDPRQPWNGMQDLRFAVGASLLIKNYRKGMSSEAVEQALTAKIAHMCLMGILDDVIDRSDWSYLDAKELYDVVLPATLDADFDPSRYARRVATILRAQPDLVGPVVALTERISSLWNASPYGRDYTSSMDLLNNRLADGQAVSVFQKTRSFRPRQLERIAASFSSPTNRLRWWERLAAHVSVVTRYNLIDFAFSQLRPDRRAISRFMAGWYYLDAASTLLHHVPNVYPSLRNGISNLSLFGMRETELHDLSSLEGYNPDLTLGEYESHLRDIARLAASGLDILAGEFDLDAGHHALIGVMMPVVLLADWIGTQDRLLDIYFREVAPAIRRAAVGPPHGVQRAIEIVAT